MKPLFIFSFAVMFIFSLVGMILITNLTHELSHKQDFEDIANNDSICLLRFGDDAIASYSFIVNNNDLDEYERIHKYTEYKALGIDILIWVFYTVCLVVVLSWELDRR